MKKLTVKNYEKVKKIFLENLGVTEKTAEKLAVHSFVMYSYDKKYNKEPRYKNVEDFIYEYIEQRR